MDGYRLFLGLVLFMGGLAMMVLGVLYLGILNACTGPGSTSSCGSPWVAFSLMGVGVVFIVAGAVFLAKARFARDKSQYPRQYSRT